MQAIWRTLLSYCATLKHLAKCDRRSPSSRKEAANTNARYASFACEVVDSKLANHSANFEVCSPGRPSLNRPQRSVRLQVEAVVMSSTKERRILILAPTNRDADITCKMLGARDIDCVACHNVDELSRDIDQGAGALLLAEEVVAATDF